MSKDEKDREKATQFVSQLSEWVMKDGNFGKSMKRLEIVLNGVGAAIAHGYTMENKGEDEDMNDESTWITSPRNIVEMLLEKGNLLDREQLASSFGQYQVYKDLEDMYNLPDAEKPDEA